jgi:SAM-dependent methyltransferase
MSVAADDVARVLSRHLPIYARRRPVYQAVMLEALERLWKPSYRRVLDVGGGTGVIAQTVAELFDVGEVVSVDVQDRYLPSLTIGHRVYDGRRLPFDDASFDVVLFNNVLHHVDVEGRAPLLTECRRVAPTGDLLIKDHLAIGWVDHARLTALDAIGNIPFGGMIKASYLTDANWRALADASGYRIAEAASGPYRSGAMAALFPNRLETTMRWEAITRVAE